MDDAFEEFQGAYFSACESVGVRPLKTVLWQARVAADASRAEMPVGSSPQHSYGWAGAGPGYGTAPSFAALASAAGKGVSAERTLKLTPATVPRLELLDLRAVLLALLSSASQLGGRVFARWVHFEFGPRPSLVSSRLV